MILVIGGRSKIGSAVIGELLARGEDVRASVRRVEDAASPPDGAQAVVGDLGEPDTLASAMAGVQKLFLLCGRTPDEVSFNQNAINAGEEANAELVGRSSILGADSGSPATFVRDHGLRDEYLQSGASTTRSSIRTC